MVIMRSFPKSKNKKKIRVAKWNRSKKTAHRMENSKRKEHSVILRNRVNNQASYQENTKKKDSPNVNSLRGSQGTS